MKTTEDETKTISSTPEDLLEEEEEVEEDLRGCILCECTFEAWNPYLGDVCLGCAAVVHDMVEDITDVMDRDIRKQYRITHVENPPVQGCMCNYKDVVAFDYFTVKNESEDYYLNLSTVCRGCGGYRVVKIPETVFPIHVKNAPRHLGIRLNGKRKDYSDLYS